MKGTDRADKYLSYYSDLKTVKWLNVSAKLYILQLNFVCKTLNQTRHNAQEFPARGSKFPEIRSPESK